jgi:cobalt/nickel transport system ATP-binding protein
VVIEVENLSYTYPDGTVALREVTLSLAAGERVALLGPNGAGKTTLALHLNGVIAAQAGAVSVAGTLVGAHTVREVRRQVGLVFQDPDDQLFMPTVRQDVAFGPVNYRLGDIDARVERALEAVRMLASIDRAPHHLSFGQRRRVAVATVLSMDPSILVLDEPSSNLDPASRRELAEVLTELDVTMLMVTHDLLFAWQLCPRSVVLADGRVRYDGPTESLLADPELLSRFRLELPFGVSFPPGRRLE